MNKASVSVILAVALLCACGGGGGKRGVAQQSATPALSSDEPSNVRYASADTPRIKTASSSEALADTTSLPATGTLLNLLFVGAAAAAVGSRLRRKSATRNAAIAE